MKTPLQIALKRMEIFELDVKSVFLREQAKRIRWILEDTLKEEKRQFIEFYNKGGLDMTLDETKAEQRFDEQYDKYEENPDERNTGI